MGHRPPVPPANRSPKGVSPKTSKTDTAETAKIKVHDERTNNIEQQGQQANTLQNTTHQGLQQDR
jgi:hypothetical protein